MTHEYPDRHAAEIDELCQPLTIAEAAKITNRSERTIRSWVQGGKLTAYEVEHRRKVLIYREVAETEREMRAAAKASREAIADRARAQQKAPDGDSEQPALPAT